MIRFSCPTCQKVLKTLDEGTGRKINCPKCGQRLLVPSTASARSNTAFSSAANKPAVPPHLSLRQPSNGKGTWLILLAIFAMTICGPILVAALWLNRNTSPNKSQAREVAQHPVDTQTATGDDRSGEEIPSSTPRDRPPRPQSPAEREDRLPLPPPPNRRNPERTKDNPGPGERIVAKFDANDLKRTLTWWSRKLKDLTAVEDNEDRFDAALDTLKGEVALLADKKINWRLKAAAVKDDSLILVGDLAVPPTKVGAVGTQTTFHLILDDKYGGKPALALRAGRGISREELSRLRSGDEVTVQARVTAAVVAYAPFDKADLTLRLSDIRSAAYVPTVVEMGWRMSEVELNRQLLAVPNSAYSRMARREDFTKPRLTRRRKSGNLC